MTNPAGLDGYCIGLMSGTSLDGIDAALLWCQQDSIRFVDALALPMPPGLRTALLELCDTKQPSFIELAQAEHAFCTVQAEAVTQILRRNALQHTDILALGSHGQTIEHQPEAEPPFTYQLDNPHLLSELTGCRTVSDFRRRDVAAGGQGAPLAPAFHRAVFSDENRWRVALNLGGFANITVLPPPGEGPVRGFDTGPANVLMDAWHHRHRQHPFDEHGQWARTGNIDDALLTTLMSDPFFKRRPPKSTGREYFNQNWLDTHLKPFSVAPNDVQATLLELTARTIAEAIYDQIPAHAQPRASVIPCGGGAHNTFLLNRLAAHLDPIELCECETLGWSPDWLEACAFAWLAWQRLNHRPGNLPEVTGAKGPRVLGTVTAPQF
ncbi:anhydro-N-acetylmuramic acid kinase [Larsenimonas suaedae]|uniref:Anhydro-N-acetylmuramic acid kinase n=1 Tax=Larsenimonas suaedae TaxID=1851019 RepID=A0ABU1GY88_9GAMM|nr:anhydro-N-acetylmuramic acid kinase [Larsenimonas suaedae]MCM2973615.1 anhydro-N-acetylmuramic acid kinase [Larsenimonas suaedae]MDR5897015.1 anhydro-N-acetylmuramic acid kinase [Larsenimonas suaedae]